MGKYKHIEDPVHAVVTAFMTSYACGSTYHPKNDGMYRDATKYIEMDDYNGKKRFSFVTEKRDKDCDYIRITPYDVMQAMNICLKNDIPIYACYSYGSWFGITGDFCKNDKSMYRIYNLSILERFF